MPASGPEVDRPEIVARIFILKTYRIENPGGWYYRLKIVVQFVPSGSPPALGEMLKVDKELPWARPPRSCPLLRYNQTGRLDVSLE
jgi:hypothetical protein